MCTSGIDNLNRYNPDVYYRLENPAKKKRLSKLSVKNKKKTFLDAFSSFDWNYFLQQAKEKSDPSCTFVSKMVKVFNKVPLTKDLYWSYHVALAQNTRFTDLLCSPVTIAK